MNKSFLTRAMTLLAVVAMVTMVPPSFARETTTLPPASHAQVADTLHSASLMFIENVGQFDEGARFQVRGGDSTIWLAEDAIWVTVLEPTPPPYKGRFFAMLRNMG
jgi:hypothetical protein